MNFSNFPLQYDRQNDENVFLSAELLVAPDRRAKISLCTVAGNPTGDVGASAENEDAIQIIQTESKLLLGVFDGSANSLCSPYLVPFGINGARIVSGRLRECLPEILEYQSLSQGLVHLNNRIKITIDTLLQELKIENPERRPMSTATIVNIDFQRLSLNLSHITDSILILWRKDGTSILLTPDQVEPTIISFRAALREVRDEQLALPNPSLRKNIKDPRIQNTLQNDHFARLHSRDGTGFGVINGTIDAEQYIVDGFYSLTNVEKILLCSDGLFPEGFESSELISRQLLLEQFQLGGFESVINWKRSIENNDPEWIEYPRIKHSDDASGIMIELVD